MKLKPYIFTFLLALAMSVACFGSSFEAVDTASTSVDVATFVDIGPNNVPTATTVDAVESRLVSIDTSVPAATGKMILNEPRSDIYAAQELDGYLPGLFKPNIDAAHTTSSTKGFSGLAGNHFARADV